MDEMEDSCYTFEAVEIDLDYEFDASRYFDFTRMESLSEVREAESWFESAGSYPPSPYMAKLIIPEDILVKNVNTLPKYKNAELADAVVSNSDIGMDPELPAQVENLRELTDSKRVGCDKYGLKIGGDHQSSTKDILAGYQLRL